MNVGSSAGASAASAAAAAAAKKATGSTAASGAGPTYKSRVATNIGAEYVDRFFNLLWAYRLGQVTTGNLKAMKDATVGNNKGHPVLSDLQPHGLHKFSHETHPSIILAIPADSIHVQNVVECTRASLMVGHTDPQLFHWFKQLGVTPPRSIFSGKAELLSGDLKAEAWETTFVRHPHIHEIARIRWEKDETKTEDEKVQINKRILQEEEKTMRGMQSGDWRRKFKERERNPNREEDEEAPVFIMKPDTFALIRLRPETQIWATYSGEMKHVFEQNVPPIQVVGRSFGRFLRTMNVSRSRLVACLNMSYNMKLSNAFVHSVDDRGFYAMATEEYDPEVGGPREKWAEYRFGFGMDDKPAKDMAEIEWWMRGFFQSGTAENNQNTQALEDTATEDDTKMRYS